MASDLDDLADTEQQLCEVLAAYFEAVKDGWHPSARPGWLVTQTWPTNWSRSWRNRTGCCG
jgi:hypothetical protein